MLLLPSGSDRPAADGVTLTVAEASQAGEARRLATALARKLGFDEGGCGKAAIVVTEAANNIVKHAGQGELLLRPLERDGVGALEVLALDRGPGMADLQRCLRDGYSTAGTPGTGLGAISRLADAMEIHTLPQVGTALLARLWARPIAAGASEPALQVSAVHLPKPGEEMCGDAWAFERQPERALVLVVDGLGHGPLAAQAAREAVRIFRQSAEMEPVEIMARMHAALRSTRGAAVGLAEIRLAEQTLQFVGVGNIAATILFEGASRSTVSHNGIVGHEARKIQPFSYDFPSGALLVMHSDGLATHWRLDAYPGLAQRDLALIAGALYRDFKRGRDDVTVLAVRAEA